MSPIFAFLLFMTVAVSTIQLFSNPVDKLIKAFEGKRAKDVEAEAKRWIDDTPLGTVIAKILGGCLRYGCWFGIAFLVSWVLKPFLIIGALVSRVGVPVLGYAAFAVWLLDIALRLKKSNGKKSTEVKIKAGEHGPVVEDVSLGKGRDRTSVRVTVLDRDGNAIAGDDADIENPLIEKPNWKAVWARRLFFFLSDVYLAYVFLVGIGLISPVG